MGKQKIQLICELLYNGFPTRKDASPISANNKRKEKNKREEVCAFKRAEQRKKVTFVCISYQVYLNLYGCNDSNGKQTQSVNLIHALKMTENKP